MIHKIYNSDPFGAEGFETIVVERTSRKIKFIVFNETTSTKNKIYRFNLLLSR